MTTKKQLEHDIADLESLVDRLLDHLSESVRGRDLYLILKHEIKMSDTEMKYWGFVFDEEERS